MEDHRIRAMGKGINKCFYFTEFPDVIRMGFQVFAEFHTTGKDQHGKDKRRSSVENEPVFHVKRFKGVKSD